MENIQKNKKTQDLSFRAVIRYLLWFYIGIILSTLAVAGFYTIYTMKKEADFVAKQAKYQLDIRIGSTVKLLTSLANDKRFLDPSIPFTQKAEELNKYSDTFGYFMICLVDKDFNVWDENGTDANLAARDYMQRMYATGEVQITDSFAAGSDGVTLNYTIAVPVMREGKFDGGIFASIYFDELEKSLEASIYDTYQQLILYGGENQVMSASNSSMYGEKYMDIIQNSIIFGTNAKQVEEDMYNLDAGSYWCLNWGNLEYNSYVPVENTAWLVFCKLGFWNTFAQYLPQLSGMLLMATIFCAIIVVLTRKYLNAQMGTIDMLITSVQELEKKIYQNEKPENVDFREIISLTNKGLTDGLTGVITRTVFLNQIPFKIKSVNAGEIAAMCFVDLDDLKTINDSYGHGVGDSTLKDIGYVLREYEKKYDGLVGRYGGDEFIIFLQGFNDEEALEKIVAEMTDKLHFDVSTGNAMIHTHCSVGVAICDNTDSGEVETLIKRADDMLYNVKQNGKGTYRIHRRNQ